LGLIGFVFSSPNRCHFFIISFHRNTYVLSGHKQIGFVFSTKQQMKPQINADKRGFLLFVIPVKTGIHPQYAALSTMNDKIGFVWVCFFGISCHKNLHKPL